jgi:DNA-binding transcriptional MerR regulator
MGTSSRKKINTEKLFFKIGEVSDVAEIEPHVLRYWESEFSFLSPRKNKTGQRVYTRKDLELVLQIKNLLYKEKYTIAGVKRKFGTNSLNKSSVSVQTIHGVKKKLKEILNTLNRDIVTHKPPPVAADSKKETQLNF